MIDLRKTKNLDLSKAGCLKEDVSYVFKDEISGKDLVAKLIGYYNDEYDDYLVSEFKKMFLLSGEPEIGTVYFLATANLNGTERSCYVMDFIKGKTVGSIIKENTILSLDFIIDVIEQIASGLEKAHNYEISHGDLHEENIIIDNFGFVKIIDFAFWEKKEHFQKSAEVDIKYFNEIVLSIISKCQDFDRSGLKIITDLCSSITSFKNLKKNIQLFEDIIFDYNLLDDSDKQIISLIVHEIPSQIKLSQVLNVTGVEIPVNPEFEITEKESERYIKGKGNGVRIHYLDSRLERIQYILKNQFNVKLHSLRQCGLINWNVWVINVGDIFIGPYKFNYSLSLTPKLIKWKRANDLVKFLEPVIGKDLIDLLTNG